MTSLAASGGSDGGDGATTDVRDAILPRYADIIDVGSEDDGNRAPVIDRGNIDGGLPTSTMACAAHEGFSNNGWERVVTPAAATVTAGRGGAEAPAGGNDV